MVSVRITNPQMPHVGTGRWTLPELILKSKRFNKEMLEKGMKLASDIQNIQERTNDTNTQQMFEDFKIDMMTNTRNIAKVEVPKLKKQIEMMKKDLKAILNTKKRDKAGVIEDAGILQKKISALENLRHAAIRMSTKVKDKLEG